MSYSGYISVVVPLYNAEQCIEAVVNHLVLVLKHAGYADYELILVDDGSKDNTWGRVLNLKTIYGDKIKAIRLSKNYGQQKATFCGLVKALGDVVVTIDDDGSHPLEHLPDWIKEFEGGSYDVMYVIPDKVRYPFYRKILSDIYKKLSRYENPDAGKGSSFRILSKKIVSLIVNHASHLIVIDEIILWYTQNIVWKRENFLPSMKIRSTYSYKKLFLLSKNTLMISTTMPLIFVRVLGFVVSLLSFLAGTYYLIMKFVFHYAQRGYTSIIVSILFGVGLILYSLGIIGEYIAYILMDIHKKPPYHIKEEL